jgi:serine/threonine protein kinase
VAEANDRGAAETAEARRELREGRYVLVRTLGEGAQGETYEAIDNGPGPRAADPAKKRFLVEEWQRYIATAKGTKTEPPRIADGLVAIKCFRVGKAKAWKDVELAEREATTLRSLSHPNLPRYIEHFEEDGALYLVMEKIEGESLAELRRQKKKLSVPEVIRMLEDAGDALEYLSTQMPGIVHRDIKPGNVIRRPDGSFAIVDFGSVRDRLKPAGGSTVVGTFGYMAPEQFQGRASPKSDVYGVAATALTMLTGVEPEDLPHEGLGIDVPRAVPRGTPAPLVRALTAMLVPDPDRRIGSVEDALTILRGHKPNTRGRSRTREPEWSSEAFVAYHQKRAKRLQKDIEERVRRDVERKLRKAERKEARRERRAARRQGGLPFLPLLVTRLALLAATLVVWATVGLAVPIVLTVLSLLFGSALRRAAAACVRAARQSQSAMWRASGRLGGREPELQREQQSPDVRIEIETETETETETEGGGPRVALEPLESLEPLGAGGEDEEAAEDTTDTRKKGRRARA